MRYFGFRSEPRILATCAMQRVKKSVLVPYTRRRDVRARRSRRALSAVPALVRGRAASSRRATTARRRASTSTTTACARISRPTTRTAPPNRSSSRCATGRSATCTANGGSRARAGRVQGRIRARLRIRDARSSSGSSVRCSATSRTRSSMRSSAAPKRCTRRARERHRRLGGARASRTSCRVELPARRDASPMRSRGRGLVARYGLDAAALAVRACSAGAPPPTPLLADGDRVEITRAARRRSQGSARAGARARRPLAESQRRRRDAAAVR